jgi:predicted transcriptional regulator
MSESRATIKHFVEKLAVTITAAQCRAARGLVDMSQADLAAAAVVTRGVIIDFEGGVRTPQKANLDAIQRVLEAAGVVFTDGDEPGVKLRSRK